MQQETKHIISILEQDTIETKQHISSLQQDITEIKQHILQSNNLILNENEIKEEKSNALDYHHIKKEIKNVLYQSAKS